MFGKSLAELLLLAAFVLAFSHFLFGGAVTFKWSDGDELAAGAAQFSFLVTGAIASFMIAYFTPIKQANGLAGLALLMASLALYEWARRTIKDRGFHIAWSGDVPDGLCAEGPYRLIRHPFYLSYMLAFLALLAAMPTLATLAIFLFNAALFAHAAISDERSLDQSALAEDYAGYRRATGMLFPRIGLPGGKQ